MQQVRMTVKLLEGFYFCSCLYPNCKNQIVSTHNATANHCGCYTVSVWEKGRGSTNQEAQLWIFIIDVRICYILNFKSRRGREAIL